MSWPFFCQMRLLRMYKLHRGKPRYIDGSLQPIRQTNSTLVHAAADNLSHCLDLEHSDGR